jgi:hypothetical protein
MKKTILALLCFALALPGYAGALTVSTPQTDANGVVSYDASSSYNRPAGLPNAEDQEFFGDGLEEFGR